MSRSHNARRGTRARHSVDPHPQLSAFREELRQENIARIGAPRVGDARRIQGANDAILAAADGDPCCGVCAMDTWDYDDDWDWVVWDDYLNGGAAVLCAADENCDDWAACEERNWRISQADPARWAS